MSISSSHTNSSELLQDEGKRTITRRREKNNHIEELNQTINIANLQFKTSFVKASKKKKKKEKKARKKEGSNEEAASFTWILEENENVFWEEAVQSSHFLL